MLLLLFSQKQQDKRRNKGAHSCHVTFVNEQYLSLNNVLMQLLGLDLSLCLGVIAVEPGVWTNMKIRVEGI